MIHLSSFLIRNSEVFFINLNSLIPVQIPSEIKLLKKNTQMNNFFNNFVNNFNPGNQPGYRGAPQRRPGPVYFDTLKALPEEYSEKMGCLKNSNKGMIIFLNSIGHQNAIIIPLYNFRVG